MKVSTIMQGTFDFIVCSTEFVENGFKFKTHSLKTTNCKLSTQNEIMQ